MRASHRRVVWTALLVCSTAAVPATFGQAKCPPIMADLMPRGAANLVGNYDKAGEMGLGSAGADLEADPPCGNKNIKYPGHVKIDVTHYGARSSKHFLVQTEFVEHETLQSERAEFERKRPRTASPITTEGVSTGEGVLMYFEYSTSCGVHPGVEHHAYLMGLVHSRHTALRVDIAGSLSAAAARSAAREVMQKFAMARFDQS